MKVVDNDLVIGSSGRIGDHLVFRQKGGKTIIAKRPRARITPDSAAQKAVKELFFNAVLYAKAVIADAAKKAKYQAKTTGNQTAYNLAVSDFCKAPEIRSCDSSAYTGLIGQTIHIRAIDDFKVNYLSMRITDAVDQELESGAAVLADNGVDWVYTTKLVNPDMAGTKLIVTAIDLPGNATTKEFILP